MKRRCSCIVCVLSSPE